MLVQRIRQRSGMISFALESPGFESLTDILSLSFLSIFYVVSVIAARRRTLLMKILSLHLL